MRHMLAANDIKTNSISFMFLEVLHISQEDGQKKTNWK